VKLPLLQRAPAAVARAPFSIYAKLLAAFLIIVGLLIVIGAVSLAELDRVNQRAEDLVKLQRKIAAYRHIQHDTTAQLYTVTSALLVPDDRTLDATLRQLNQFGYDLDRLQFVARDEAEILGRVRTDYEAFIGIVTEVIELVRAGKVAQGREIQIGRAGPLAERLERLTNELVNKAEADMVARADEGQEDYIAARRLIIAFAVGSILLALGLGYAISWSLVEPVRRMDARFSEIAAGDFTKQVEVGNRDELGALAGNLNRMSDELGRRTLQLEEANRAKSRFLAVASHDLRQPVHALGLFVAQLQAAHNPSARQRIIEKVEASTSAVTELIEALLDISKLDAGTVESQLTEFALAPLLDRVEQAFSTAAQAQGLRLRVRSTRLHVATDPMLLERILRNLAANAVRYTREGGIVIAARKRGARARIEVWDTGVGIAPQDQRHIFEEFYRIGSAPGESSQGLGLGLAIVERLAHLLGLSVSVRSVAGSGSVFAVEVPLAVGGTISITPLTEPHDILRFDGLRVLIIDDDAPAREAAAGLLTQWGCETLLASCGKEAQALFAARTPPPSVIISDYRLAAGELGTDVVQRIRRHLGNNVPAVIVSADASSTSSEAVAAAHMHLLHKPLKPANLRAMLHHLLSTSIEHRAPESERLV
jgi:signal transduction histidine kinase/ActR/RegA family two-component response regulator